MRAAREMLAQAGLDMSRYHEESFSFDEQAAAPAPEPRATSTGSGFTVRFERSQRSLGCAADQTVLDAARAALRLPSSCTQGMCGTCKVRLLSGEVDMRHQGGIRQRDRPGHGAAAAAAPERPDHREVSAGATSQIRQALFPSTVSIGQP